MDGGDGCKTKSFCSCEKASYGLDDLFDKRLASPVCKEFSKLNGIRTNSPVRRRAETGNGPLTEGCAGGTWAREERRAISRHEGKRAKATVGCHRLRQIKKQGRSQEGHQVRTSRGAF